MNDAVRNYLSQIGRKGGRSRSPKKLAACRRQARKAAAARWNKKHELQPVEVRSGQDT